MSIPITCAGCHAAFEVPDGLAGKTIRCTSCKAQMAVPAADQAETLVPAVRGQAAAGESKKPFGFGSGAKTATASASCRGRGRSTTSRPRRRAARSARPAQAVRPGQELAGEGRGQARRGGRGG